jgi:hypothetical protein
MELHQTSGTQQKFLPVSEVLTPVFTESSIFWDITPCSPFKVDLLYTVLLFGLFFDTEDGDMFLRNVGWISTNYTALYPRRYNSSTSCWLIISSDTSLCTNNWKSWVLPEPLMPPLEPVHMQEPARRAVTTVLTEATHMDSCAVGAELERV